MFHRTCSLVEAYSARTASPKARCLHPMQKALPGLQLLSHQALLNLRPSQKSKPCSTLPTFIIGGPAEIPVSILRDSTKSAPFPGGCAACHLHPMQEALSGLQFLSDGILRSLHPSQESVLSGYQILPNNVDFYISIRETFD